MKKVAPKLIGNILIYTDGFAGGGLNLDQTGICEQRLKFTILFWSGKTQKVYLVLEPRTLIIHPVLELLILL